MPPKKNVKDSVVKSENSETNSAPNERDSKRAPMKNKEISSRTLRPRKPPALVESIPTKPTKAKLKKESNHASKEPAKGKRAKTEKKPEEGESEAKVSKIESEESNDNDEPLTAAIYEFKATTIQGDEVSLSKYKGHVCIIVNVASRCGHTASNYKELVELHDKYSDDKGLRILAFPCNQFGKQEPGDNDKICEFAKKKNINFDMFEKIDVNGKTAHPLWKYLTSQKEGPKGAKIDWNFTKFLIDKDGQVVDRFKSSIKPLALVKELENLW